MTTAPPPGGAGGADRGDRGDRPPPGPPAGRQRSNGLTADSYVPVAECDPRLTDAVLGALADAGVAAYTAPSTGRRGGYLDVQLPARPVDQVFADATRSGLAAQIVLAELAPAELAPAELAPAEEPAPAPETPTEPLPGASGPRNEAAAFAELVATFYSDTARSDAIRPEPGPPPAPAPPPGIGSDLFDLDTVEHFEPPEPEPIPRPGAATRWALAALLGGIALLFAPAVDGGSSSTGVQALAIAAIFGAVTSLVWRMHERDDDDDDPGDGAVV
ncbi:MAG: hypothetical protein ACYDAQ_18390 [Mycobacteriales bacterium]